MTVRVLPILALFVASLAACASQQVNPSASTFSGTVTPCPNPPIPGDTCVAFDWTKAQTFVDPQPAGNTSQATPQFIPATQKVPAHYRYAIPDGFMDAYPDWPHLHYLILEYSNGERIWGMPLYGTPNCPNIYTCKQALFDINKGPILEVLTLDGKPVLESSLLQITDPKSHGVVYLAIYAGRMLTAPDLQSLSQQVSQAQQSASQAAAPSSATQSSGEEHPYLKAGVQIVEGTLAPALVLATAYLNYRAQVQSSYNSNNISCTSSEVGSFWYTNCH